ncbi:Uncharacterized protein EJ110_NYTH48630 [Nymphaea thermarum]|nr:Uncharacterized protein EJ110_NYTH48630 [Nymphaea thermarum]
MDDTLYPMSTGLNVECRRNIEEYMVERLHMEKKEVPRMCVELYEEYGTTMAGLKALGFEFDNDEFHQYVHGRLPYENLKPDPVLKTLLLSMPQRKIIFTNADKAHAARVLRRLGLEGCFDRIICFETLNPSEIQAASDRSFLLENGNSCADSDDSSGSESTESTKSGLPRILCKPSIEAFQATINIAAINPERTIFFDDSARNVASAKKVGFTTAIVGKEMLVPGADFAVNSIHNIREALTVLREHGKEEQIGQVLPPRGVETAVLA